MLTIDGSFGEGGGQILRTALSLAAVTGQSVKVENIRAGREKPGLRPQHLTGLLAVAEICGAEVEGAEVGSDKVVFRPRAIRPGAYEFDVSRVSASAGSAAMVLQTILWPLAFAQRPSRVVIRGGTHVPHAPTFDFIDRVFLPTVADMGLLCHCSMTKAGYYPIGGGEILLEVRPVEDLKPITLTDRSEPIMIELTSAVSNLPLSIAERQMSTGVQRLKKMKLTSHNDIREYPSPGKGTVFFITAVAGNVRAGFQSLGELRKRAERVADDACDEFSSYLGSSMALDKHLADQLIIPMALAQGDSSFTTCEITQHLLTNLAIVEKFLNVHFHISRGVGEPGRIDKTEP